MKVATSRVREITVRGCAFGSGISAQRIEDAMCYLLLTLVPAIAMGDVYQEATIWTTTEAAYELAWNRSPGADYYEIRSVSVETGLVTGTITATTPPVTMTLPGVGHWDVQVRACNDSGCSGWAGTRSAGTIGGEESPFWVYQQLPAATGLEVQ